VFSRVDALSLTEHPFPKTTSTHPALRQLEITSNLRQLNEQDLNQLAQLNKLEELILLGFDKTAPPLKNLPANLQKLTLGNAIPISAKKVFANSTKDGPHWKSTPSFLVYSNDWNFTKSASPTCRLGHSL
jgi:hypothetical protein